MDESVKKDGLTEMQQLRAEYPVWAFRRLRMEDVLELGYLPSREELRGEPPPQDLVERVRNFLMNKCAGTGDVDSLIDHIFEEVRRYYEEEYYRKEAQWVRKQGEEIEQRQAKEHGWTYPQGNPYKQIKEFFRAYEEAYGKLGHIARNTIMFEIPEAMNFHWKLAILAGAFTQRNDLFERMEGDRLTEVAKRFNRGPKSKIERKEMLSRLADLLREHLGRTPTQNEFAGLQTAIFGKNFAVKRTVTEANKKLPPEDFLNWFNGQGIVPENITERQARLEALRRANADMRKYRNSKERALTKEDEERLYASIWPD